MNCHLKWPAVVDCLRTLASEPSRVDAEFGAEGMIEVRQVTESCIQSNLEHLVGTCPQPQCGFSQARAQNVLVGSCTSDLPENAQKMKLAHVSVGCQPLQGKWLSQIRFDETKRG